MIKVFLVEDEYAIREGIKKSVNWEAHGFELCGEAGDGEVAFPKIIKTRPDILITDIRMPFMDGLELAALVKKELPDIKIIVLSGYDDFNYAQKAISIGVEEYILKPVSGDTLLSELGKVAENIINRRRDDEMRRQYMKDREEIRILERQKFIHDMIDRKLSMQESLELGRELGIDITAAFYCVVLMQVFPRNPKSADADEYSGVSEEIYRRIKELYADVSHVFLYEQVGDVLCFLEKADSPSEMETNVTSGIANLESLMKSYTDNIYFISVGKPVERMRDVNLSYDDASRKFAERYMCDDSFVFYGDDMPRTEMLRDTAEKYRRESGKQKAAEKFDLGSLNIGQMSQKTIFHFLRNGTLSEVEDFTEDYFGSIGRDALESLMLRRYVLIEAFFACAALLESLGMEKEKMAEAFGEYGNPLRFSESYEDARNYIVLLLTHAIGYRNSMADKRYNEIIDRAKKYIQENYQNEDMSLQSVASKVNVSSNHFSTIFRKETGENFIDYLTAVRMDKAKELLCLTGMKSSDVGFEVGYRDPHYFSYIFKKTQGMSPKEYRRAKKES